MNDNTQEVLRIKKITTLTGIIIAISVALSIPAIYFAAAYYYQTMWLETEADTAADAVSELIYEYPDTWNFQITRIEDILLRLSHHNELHYEVVEYPNELLTALGNPAGNYNIKIESSLSNGEKNVGKITVSYNLSSMFERLAMVFLIGILFAIGTYSTLRFLPFAALSKLNKSLSDSKNALKKEIYEKEAIMQLQKKSSEKLDYQVHHDVLTGLPNRKSFYGKLGEALEYAQREKKKVWIIIIDINRFKEINDVLGHPVGDEVLKVIAKRLILCMNKNTVAARLGGDEFGVLIANSDHQQVKDMTKCIQLSQQRNIHVSDISLPVDLSCGIAEFPLHGDNRHTLLRNADLATFRAKTRGETWMYYQQENDLSEDKRLVMASDLRNALKSRDLEVYYQPKVTLDEEKVFGFEALTRWTHPVHGMISPDLFIPMAEQTNVIHDLTYWVMDTSLAQLKSWQLRYNSDWSVAVNLSARSLQNHNLIKEIEKLLRKHDVQARHLTLEITETSIMHEPEKSQKLVELLANMGIRISIDDFGTGYSSLSYLKRLAAHEIKIDRSFIANLLTDSDDKIIVESTIKLAHDLDLSVVAEGIESEHVGKMLNKIGCEFAQGYYYSKPKSANDIDQWLSSQLINDIKQISQI